MPAFIFCLAFPARFERAAFRLGGERSILLSYGNRGFSGATDCICQMRLSDILAQEGLMVQGGRACALRRMKSCGTFLVRVGWRLTQPVADAGKHGNHA